MVKDEYKWPDGILYYKFLATGTSSLKSLLQAPSPTPDAGENKLKFPSKVTTAMKAMSAVTNIKFVKASTDN